MPKLEETGLITKTVDRAVAIEAIPVEESLSYIVSMKQQKANQRITRLKADLKALANAIKETRRQSETTTQEQENTQATFLSAGTAVKNKLEMSYENARTKCDLVINFELLMRKSGTTATQSPLTQQKKKPQHSSEQHQTPSTRLFV